MSTALAGPLFSLLCLFTFLLFQWQACTASTLVPTWQPSLEPTVEPTLEPIFLDDPTLEPTLEPSFNPSFDPTFDPTLEPTRAPATIPSVSPTNGSNATNVTADIVNTHNSNAVVSTSTLRPTISTKKIGNKPTRSGKLSFTALIVIIVCVSLVILLFIVLVFLWLYWTRVRRKSKRKVFRFSQARPNNTLPTTGGGTSPGPPTRAHIELHQHQPQQTSGLAPPMTTAMTNIPSVSFFDGGGVNAHTHTTNEYTNMTNMTNMSTNMSAHMSNNHNPMMNNMNNGTNMSNFSSAHNTNYDQNPNLTPMQSLNLIQMQQMQSTLNHKCNRSAAECVLVNQSIIPCMREFEQWLALQQQQHWQQRLMMVTVSAVFMDPIHYNPIRLQNDYNHLIWHHSNDSDLYYMFSQIVNHNNNNSTKHQHRQRKCNAGTCLVISNHVIVSGLQLFHHISIRFKTEIFCKLHFFLIHSYDFYRFMPQEILLIENVINSPRRHTHKHKQKSNRNINTNANSNNSGGRQRGYTNYESNVHAHDFGDDDDEDEYETETDSEDDEDYVDDDDDEAEEIDDDWYHQQFGIIQDLIKKKRRMTTVTVLPSMAAIQHQQNDSDDEAELKENNNNENGNENANANQNEFYINIDAKYVKEKQTLPSPRPYMGMGSMGSMGSRYVLNVSDMDLEKQYSDMNRNLSRRTLVIPEDIETEADTEAEAGVAGIAVVLQSQKSISRHKSVDKSDSMRAIKSSYKNSYNEVDVEHHSSENEDIWAVNEDGDGDGDRDGDEDGKEEQAEDATAMDSNNGDSNTNTKKGNVFSFGIRFEYWLKYQHNANYSERKSLDFKQEMLSNNIRAIDIQDWDEMSEKCMTYLECDHVRSLKAFGPLCYYYGIEKQSLIATRHMLSLIFYCNFDELQALFSGTFRLSLQYSTIAQLKARNSEYYHWSKYLRESVELFGTAMRSVSAHKSFYHGISCEMLFDSTISLFACPTSCTAQLSVAYNFSDDLGIIMALNQYGLDVCYFDVSWLSKFASEDERLFVGGFQPLVIKTVICTQSAKNYRLSIQAINVMQSVIQRRFKCERINKQIRRYLRALMKKKIDSDSDAANASEASSGLEYNHKLFNHICNNWQTEIEIVIPQLFSKKYYAKLKSIFFVGDVDEKKKKEKEKENENGNTSLLFNFQLLFDLFTQCPKFVIAGDLGNDGVVLSHELFEYLLRCLTRNDMHKKNKNGNTDESELMQLVLYAPNEVDVININECIVLFAQQFQRINWFMAKEEANEMQPNPSLVLTCIQGADIADTRGRSVLKSETMQ